MNHNRRMLSRWMTFLVWALVAGSGVYWGVRLFARPPTLPPQVSLAQPGPAAGADLSRLFGVSAPPPPPPVAVQAPVAPEASRFKLLGVVAAPPAVSHAQGVALIAVDGKIARAFRVGAAIDGDLVLQSVQPRAVSIGPRGSEARVSLELPPLPPPATGVPGEAGSAAPPAVAPAAAPAAPPAAALIAPPPQLALPPGAGNLTLQQQLRLRGMRPLNGPTGAVQTPLQVMPGQADDSAAELAAPHDGRNLR